MVPDLLYMPFICSSSVCRHTKTVSNAGRLWVCKAACMLIVQRANHTYGFASVV